MSESGRDAVRLSPADTANTIINPRMEVFLIKALQLIVALAFLVIIHEFGHFIFARIFGIRVEKFYMFFDPYFSLVKWKPKPKKDADPDKSSWRDTEYGIGWLPLGGYCKISGMIDESMDTEQMKQEPKPWEFRTKPAWQRLLVMLGGVLFNFILAILIYAGIAMHWAPNTSPLRLRQKVSTSLRPHRKRDSATETSPIWPTANCLTHPKATILIKWPMRMW